MKNKKMTALAPIVVLVAAILWGAVGVFTKQMYSMGFNPFQVSMLRCFVAAIVIVPIMFFHNSSKLKLRCFRDVVFFLISGTFGLALCYSAYFITIQKSTLSIAAVMLYSAPIMVTVMAAFIFKEKITGFKSIALIFAFAGCIVMSGILGGSGVKLSAAGLGIGFLSGLGYALYNIGSRMALKYYDTYTVTSYTFIFAVMGMIPFTPVRKTVQLMSDNPNAILLALGLGILSTLIPYTLYVLALNYVEVGKASILAFMEPVAATAVGLIFFREMLTMNTAIAMGLILVSIVLMNVNFSKAKANADDGIRAGNEENSWITEREASVIVSRKMRRRKNARLAFSEESN